MASLMNLLSDQTVLLAVAVVVPSLFIVKIVTTNWKRKQKKKYPPIVSTIFNQLYNFKRLHHYTTDLAEKYRTFRLFSPLRIQIYTADPANVEYILKTNFGNYGKGQYTYEILQDLLGDGIFSVDGEKWREQRKLSSNEFSTRVLRDFSSQIFRKNAAKLANIISDDSRTGRSIDIQGLFMRSTMDSIFKVGFGVELDSMCGTSEEGSLFCKAFDDANASTCFRFVTPFWRTYKFLNIGSEAKLKKNVKVVDNFVYKLIHNKIEKMRNPSGISSIKKEDMLSRFLQVTEGDPTYLRDIILSFMIAGKDTTAGTLSWFIYMLCKHPNVQEKIAQEVKQATNMNQTINIDEFASNLSDQALDKMHYLHATLTETLRLYPSVPLDPKECFSDDTLPDGSCVRKGDVVYYLPYAMGRMKFIWGDDAEEFRPERWLDEDGIFKPDSPFKFTAFQAGPRICLGKEFAYKQMKIFSAVLLSFYMFKLSDKKVKYRTMMTLHVDGGLHIHAIHRLNNSK